ncbi:MAG: xanthine dehydrogenase family protein subunit M [Desulfurococcaceae archaeon]
MVDSAPYPVNINVRNTRIIPIVFDYYEPKSIEETLELLSKHGDKAKILAGGTDLLVKIKTGQVEPKVIINIKKIRELRYIIEEDNLIRIGSLTTIRDLERSEVIKKHLPALHDSVKQMGSIQIRNMATIGGNICNASPAADTAPPLLIYNAKAVAMSINGVRVIPLEEFFTGPGKTLLRPDEILTELIVEKRKDGSSSFKKITRVAVDLAIANTAVYLSVENNIIKDIKIALGSVAPKPVRAWETEKLLKGLLISSSDLKNKLQHIDQEISPISDARSTANYRRYIVKVLVYDAIETAYNRIIEG